MLGVQALEVSEHEPSKSRPSKETITLAFVTRKSFTEQHKYNDNDAI